MTTGRFAPSPSADLHVGNLRTALLAWLFARTGTPSAAESGSAGRFVLRIEDLDPGIRHTPGEPHPVAQRQFADLAAIGLDWDEPVVTQSERLWRHHEAIGALNAAGLVYPCWCSRREIAEAAQAPNTPGFPHGAYPGTCAGLDTSGRSRRATAAGRPPALRLRAHGATVTIDDLMAGRFTGLVDDFVVRRADGVPAYNLAVVVDDADQGVNQVVRGDDLLDSTPRQVVIHQLLDLDVPTYAHVPLVLDDTGGRLAKRAAATTLAELGRHGVTPTKVLSRMGASLGLCEPGEDATTTMLAERFDPSGMSRSPWCITPGPDEFLEST